MNKLRNSSVRTSVRFLKFMIGFSAAFNILLISGAGASDCNSNGTEDSIDLVNSPSSDCNANSFLDQCDLIPFPQFVRWTLFYTFSGLVPQVVADITGDGKPDVLALAADGSEIVLLKNESNGYFSRSQYAAFGLMFGLISADVDHDGTADLVGWNSTTVFIIHVDPVSKNPIFAQQFSGGAIVKVITADLNGDLFPDIVIGQSDSPAIKLALNSNGTIGAVSTVSLASNGFEHQIIDLAAVDLNANGVDDVLAILDSSYIEGYSPDSSVSFPTVTMNGTGRRIFTTDLDTDGDVDLIFVGQQEFVTLRNNGGFNYSTVFEQAISDPDEYVQYFDFDLDSIPDLLFGGNLGIYRGRTDGTFDIKPVLTQANSAKASVIADFDQDSRPDLFFGGTGTFLNKSGTWSHDADSDGKPDECQPGLLTSPLYVPWNSFLGTINILELINSVGGPASIKVELLDLRGNKLSERQIALSAGQQFDLIVNDLPGFSANTYGTIKLTFTGVVDGRMSIYRPRAGTNEYEFATTFPLVQPLLGQSAVSFNTFDPQISGSSRERRSVNEWLTLINLSPTKDLTVWVERFDLVGAPVFTFPVFLRPFERLDFEGGHEHPGPNKVGENVITPDDPTIPYLAFSVRYGVTADTNGRFLRYRYANTVVAQSGLLPTNKIPFTRNANTESIAELANPSAALIGHFVQIFNAAGAVVAQFPVVIAPHGQLHLQASAYLPPGENGSFQLLYSFENPYGYRTHGPVLQLVSFVTDPKTKELVSAYSIPSRVFYGEEPEGSFNTFLGFEDTLRIHSTVGTNSEFQLDLFRDGILQSQSSFSLMPHQTRDVVISPALGALPNTYGVLHLRPLGGTGLETGLIAEVFRRRPLSGGKIDFVAEAPLR